MTKPRLSMKLLWQFYAEVADKKTTAHEFLFLVDQKMKLKSKSVPTPQSPKS